jgi:hypothetical protein
VVEHLPSMMEALGTIQYKTKQNRKPSSNATLKMSTFFAARQSQMSMCPCHCCGGGLSASRLDCRGTLNPLEQEVKAWGRGVTSPC